MKRLVLTLLLALSLIACSPKYSYFVTETKCPQCVVDSLQGPNTSSYLDWSNMTAVGIHEGDSTDITIYVNATEKESISVTVYGNSSEATVKERKRIK